jgi:hypothetical protein
MRTGLAMECPVCHRAHLGLGSDVVSKLIYKERTGWLYCQECDTIFHSDTGEVAPIEYSCTCFKWNKK